jgi:hypothetical protein
VKEEALQDLTAGINPFGSRSQWHGRLVSVDGVAKDDFTAADVAEVIARGETGDDWEGTVAAVMRLHDGRFVAYETFYGPTGDGFSEDAYGGDADLHFASTLDAVVRFGLTDIGRDLCSLGVEAKVERGARKGPEV